MIEMGRFFDTNVRVSELTGQFARLVCKGTTQSTAPATIATIATLGADNVDLSQKSQLSQACSVQHEIGSTDASHPYSKNDLTENDPVHGVRDGSQLGDSGAPLSQEGITCTDDRRVEFEERAAIMGFDGAMSREEAERGASAERVQSVRDRA